MTCTPRFQTERIAPPPSHEKQQKLSNGSGGGSKFADVQRRWNNGEVNNASTATNYSGEYSDPATTAADRQTPTPSPFVSGSTPVKSLTGRFDKENLLADFESCADATALRQLVGEQMREIETLKSQVRDRKNDFTLQSWPFGSKIQKISVIISDTHCSVFQEANVREINRKSASSFSARQQRHSN